MALDLRGFHIDTQPQNQGINTLSNTVQEIGRYKQEKENRNQKEKEADDYRKYNIVKDTIDPTDLATGNASADDYFGQETKRVFSEIISDPKIMKLPYAELYGTIQSKWQPLVQSAGKIKNGLAQIDATVKAAGTEDTNLATDKLAPAAKLKFIDEIMPVGQDGVRAYNTAGFNPDKNHAIDILNGDDYWRYMKGADPLIKYIKDYKTDDISLQRNMADKSIIPYKGKQSPFSKLNITPGQFGTISGTTEPGFDISTEDNFVTEDDGTQVPVKLMSADVYKAHVEDIPANKRSLDYLWNNYKEKYNIKPKNATEEDKRKRAFAVGVFKAHDPSQMSRQTSQHLPSNRTYNTTNVNTGGGGANVNDVNGRIVKSIQEDVDKGYGFTRFNKLKGDEQTLIKDFINKDLAQDDKYGDGDILVSLNANNEVEVYSSDAYKNGKNPTTLITTLPGGFSNLRGKQPGVKENRAIIAEGNNKTPKPAGKTTKAGLPIIK